MQQNKINVYIDSFNLYYGLLIRRPQFKWLNPVAFVKQILAKETEIPYKDSHVIQVKFFTADIRSLFLPSCSGNKKQERRHKRQQTDKIKRQKKYFRVLESHRNIEIIRGHFRVPTSTRTLPIVKRKDNRLCVTGRTVTTRIINEKGSDVNLAVNLLKDSYEEGCYGKWGIVISNDSDLCSAIETVQGDICKKSILLINPQLTKDKERSKLERAAESSLRLHGRQDLNVLLKGSQWPDKVTLADGSKIQNPWGKFSLKKQETSNSN